MTLYANKALYLGSPKLITFKWNLGHVYCETVLQTVVFVFRSYFDKVLLLIYGLLDDPLASNNKPQSSYVLPQLAVLKSLYSLDY